MTLQEVAENLTYHIRFFEEVNGVKVEGVPFEGEVLEVTRDGDCVWIHYDHGSKKWEVVG
jgi:hypothetical protein